MSDFENYIDKDLEKQEMSTRVKRRIGHLIPKLRNNLIKIVNDAHINQFDGWYDYTLSIMRWSIDETMSETNEDTQDDLYWEIRELLKDYMREVYSVSIRKYFMDNQN